MNAPEPMPHETSGSTFTEATPVAHRATGDGERFVVGVDGSAQSIDALRWAARIAAGTDARIEIFTTWKPRVGMAGPYIATAAGTYLNPEDDAQALLSHAVDAAYGGDRPTNLRTRAREGDPADILIEESRTAQLLVIGSRGLGQVAGLLLGSVSARCAEQAHCPVLIMHAPDQP